MERRRSLEMPINCLSSPINSPFPTSRMISNTWVEPISGDVPPGWATLTVSNRESPMKRRHLGIDSSCLNWVQFEWQVLFAMNIHERWLAACTVSRLCWLVFSSCLLLWIVPARSGLLVPDHAGYQIDERTLKMISRLLDGGEH